MTWEEACGIDTGLCPLQITVQGEKKAHHYYRDLGYYDTLTLGLIVIVEYHSTLFKLDKPRSLSTRQLHTIVVMMELIIFVISACHFSPLPLHFWF